MKAIASRLLVRKTPLQSPKRSSATRTFIAAALNAFDSAAAKLGVNAVELSERMADGGIAVLVEAATGFLHDCDLGFYRTDQGYNSESRFRAALKAVKDGVS